MAARKKYFVLIMLLLMLAAAVGNYFFVSRMYNSTVVGSSELEKTSAFPGAGGITPVTGRASAYQSPRNQESPQWTGDLQIKNISGKTYELLLFAEVPNRTGVKLSSFEVSMALADKPGVHVVPVFRQSGDDRMMAVVDVPEPGNWEIVVRMHMKNQTLEFTRRFYAAPEAPKAP